MPSGHLTPANFSQQTPQRRLHSWSCAAAGQLPRCCATAAAPRQPSAGTTGAGRPRRAPTLAGTCRWSSRAGCCGSRCSVCTGPAAPHTTHGQAGTVPIQERRTERRRECGWGDRPKRCSPCAPTQQRPHPLFCYATRLSELVERGKARTRESELTLVCSQLTGPPARASSSPGTRSKTSGCRGNKCRVESDGTAGVHTIYGNELRSWVSILQGTRASPRHWAG